MTTFSRKARFELIQRAQHIRSQILNDILDRAPIFERYLKGMVAIHVHIGGRVAGCLEYRAGPSIELPFGAVVDNEVSAATTPDDREMPVLVWVGNVPDRMRPCEGVVRLQPFDDCGMFVRDAFEVGRPVTVEERRIRLYRELRHLLNDSGIEESQLVDEIVQGRSEVVDDLSNGDGELVADWGSGVDGLRDVVSRLGVLVDRDGAVLVEPMGGLEGYELRQSFVCPVYTAERALEFWHGVSSDHERREGTDAADASGRGHPDPEAGGLPEEPAEDGEEAARLNSQPPEGVASQTETARRPGGNSATRTRSGSPEDA